MDKRRNDKPRTIVCAHCGAGKCYNSPSRAARYKYCSRKCHQESCYSKSPCKQCGKEYKHKKGNHSPFCPACFKPKKSNRPDRQVLFDLYVTERLSSGAIALRINQNVKTVKDWLRFHEIPRRSQSQAMAVKGKFAPSPEQLTDMVHGQHLSYDDIGNLFGITKTAIMYWMKKYQIRRPSAWETRRKGIPVLPSAQELKEFYNQGLSSTDIGNLIGVSHRVIINQCRKLGLPVRAPGFNGGQWHKCKDGHRVRSTYEQRVDDWLHEQGVEHSYEPRLDKHSLFAADFFANGWYVEIWGCTGDAYERRKQYKKAFYKANNLPLVEIGAHCFDATRKSLWKRKLSQVLEPPI